MASLEDDTLRLLYLKGRPHDGYDFRFKLSSRL